MRFRAAWYIMNQLQTLGLIDIANLFAQNFPTTYTNTSYEISTGVMNLVDIFGIELLEQVFHAINNLKCVYSPRFHKDHTVEPCSLINL